MIIGDQLEFVNLFVLLIAGKPKLFKFAHLLLVNYESLGPLVNKM